MANKKEFNKYRIFLSSKSIMDNNQTDYYNIWLFSTSVLDLAFKIRDHYFRVKIERCFLHHKDGKQYEMKFLKDIQCDWNSDLEKSIYDAIKRENLNELRVRMRDSENQKLLKKIFGK